MAYTRLPTSDMDTLEGAFMHMLTTCGPLSDAAINVFSEVYRDMHGQKYVEDFGTKVLIPKLARAKKIYRTASHLYSVNPMCRQNKDGLDAFWVFLEHMEEAELDSVMKHRNFGELSYVKNNIIYTVFRCRDNGAREMAMVAQRELQVERMNRQNSKYPIQERYIFLFSNEEDMKNAPFCLRSPTLFGTIKYEDSLVPTLWFDMATNVIPGKEVYD